MAGDFRVAQIAQTGEYTAAQTFVKSQADQAVYVFDGEMYDYQGLNELLESTRQQSEELFANAKDTLVPLINQSYDARVANVDKYLDWYYSIPGDYERLFNMITGSVEDFVTDQFEAKIEEGIDDSQLEAEWSTLVQQSQQLESSAQEALANYKIEGVPEWLVTVKGFLDQDSFATAQGPTHKFLETEQRLALSGAGGVATGVLAKKLVTKAIQSKACQNIISKLVSTLGVRSASTVIGGAAGTAAGPLGTAAGVAAGGAIGLGIDALLLNIDEMQNREPYKAELIATIESERAEMLSAFE